MSFVCLFVTSSLPVVHGGTPFAARIGLPATVAGLHLCAKQRGHDAQAFEMAHIRGPYLKTLDCGRCIQPQDGVECKTSMVIRENCETL